MTIMENMRYGSPFIKKGMKFKNCHGYRNTARGKQKTYVSRACVKQRRKNDGR